VTKFVKKHFFEYVRRHQSINSEMKRAMKDNKHMHIFIDNMARQLIKAQDIQMKRRGKKFTEKTMISCVEDMSETFIQAYDAMANARVTSEIAKHAKRREEQNVDEMQSTLEGNSKGAFEDMGLVIPKDQQEKPVVE